jgi:hypothetical protein
LRNGVSGLIATEFDDLVKAVKNIESVPREGCRKDFETRFTAEVMATQYERIFYDLIGTRRNGSRPHARFEEISPERGEANQWHRPSRTPYFSATTSTKWK